MSEELTDVQKTFKNLPVSYQEAMKAVVADGYGEEYPEATAAWLKWEAHCQHEFEMGVKPDENDISTWAMELGAFVDGWLAGRGEPQS